VDLGNWFANKYSGFGAIKTYGGTPEGLFSIVEINASFDRIVRFPAKL